MTNYMEMLGKQVIAKTVPGTVFGEGIVFAYIAHPSFIIERPDGSQFTWVAHLCEAVEGKDELPARELTPGE